MSALAVALAALFTLAPPGGPLPPPGDISGAAARQIQTRGAVVLDVRTPSEFEHGHVPGAVNIPHDQVASRFAELGAKDRPVVLYCRSGRRADLAAAELTRLGFTAVYNFRTVTAWPGPLEKGAARAVTPPPGR